jgi:hypothetical protein
MNKRQNGLDPARRLWILWLAQVNSVVVLTVLAWVLPGFGAIEPVAGVQLPLLIAALAALPLALVLGRWLLARAVVAENSPRQDGAPPPDPGRRLGFSVIAWVLCELPIMLGFVAVLFGGDRLHGVALGAASLVLLLLLRPSASA